MPINDYTAPIKSFNIIAPNICFEFAPDSGLHFNVSDGSPVDRHTVGNRLVDALDHCCYALGTNDLRIKANVPRNGEQYTLDTCVFDKTLEKIFQHCSPRKNLDQLKGSHLEINVMVDRISTGETGFVLFTGMHSPIIENLDSADKCALEADIQRQLYLALKANSEWVIASGIIYLQLSYLL